MTKSQPWLNLSRQVPKDGTPGALHEAEGEEGEGLSIRRTGKPWSVDLARCSPCAANASAGSQAPKAFPKSATATPPPKPALPSVDVVPLKRNEQGSFRSDSGPSSNPGESQRPQPAPPAPEQARLTYEVFDLSLGHAGLDMQDRIGLSANVLEQERCAQALHIAVLTGAQATGQPLRGDLRL